MAVSSSIDRPAKPAASRDPILPLIDGEHLTRDEFERRYDAMPGLKKAELIEGVVRMPSPVRLDQHGSPHSCLGGWLWVYRAGTAGVDSGDNTSIRLDLGLWLDPAALLSGDSARVLAVLQQGIASAEHAEFVSRLRPGTAETPPR
jgi:hypothetical protein